MRSAGECSSPGSGRTRVANPSTTPATVAWTPLAWSSVHTAKASGTYTHQAVTRARCSTANTPTPAAPSSSGSSARSSVNSTAMSVTAMMSSTTASDSSRTRTPAGSERATSARTPRAKAMSVATGIAQPREAPSAPPATAKNTSAGMIMPPTAAIIGRAAERRSASSPTVSSRLTSTPAT